jgi:hypothetical protein
MVDTSKWLPAVLGSALGVFLYDYSFRAADVVPSALHAPAKHEYLLLSKQLSDMQEQLTKVAASRCMVVNTPVLSMSVYDTPNLGVKAVPPPPPKKAVVATADVPNG